MVPGLPPETKGQDRGNSGVYLQGRYEVQVLDSFGLQSGRGDCGAIYGVKEPSRNACKPAGEWQMYDIIFRAPRWDSDGGKVAHARVTVVQNGVKIHDDVEIPKATGSELSPESPQPGPLMLQDHGSPVRYRNIWIRPLPPQETRMPATTQSAFQPQRFAELLPGFVGSYFRDVKSLDGLKSAGKPFLVRIDKTLDFGRARGQFHNTKLNNNFAVRWEGVLRILDEGDYELGLYSDDHSRLYIGDDLVIDNTRPRKEEAARKLHLVAGDYPIRLEYHQGGGSAHFHLSWKPFGAGDWQDIPEAQLLHTPQHAHVQWDQPAWEAYVWDRKAWLADWAPRYEKMDYGPFLTHTIKVNSDQTVNKGIAVRLGTNDEAAGAVFDPELLRFACAWTGGFLKLDGVAFSESHGTNPSVDGETCFLSPPEPGWSGTTNFTDPRPGGIGNMPRQRGHFIGLYRNGQQVVLSYTVGNRSILDLPRLERRDGQPVLVRHIEIGPSDRPIVLNSGKGAEPIRVPASGGITRLVVECSGNSVRLRPDAAAINLSDLCHGGPARWGQVITTKGTLGAGDGPYVVDSITVPEDNPWNAWMRFGGLDFFSDGRAALCTWSGDAWIVSGIDERLENVSWKRFAAGMFQPLGLRIVDDKVYVLGRDQITRLHDLNDDGEADFYENFNNDCIVSASFHEFAVDLQTDREGNFYFAKGGPVRPGGRGWEQITPHNGCVLRVLKDGSGLEVFATGIRAPNGMGSGPRGQITVSDNEGTWTPACRVSFINKGSFLGVVDLAHQESRPSTYEPPIYWLPHEDVDNSSGGQVWVSGDSWGPFKEHMLHLSYGMCSLSLVLLDEVEGVAQGGIVKFPMIDFDTGICRARFRNQDGQLYVTGLRGWQTRAAKDGAFQRVRYTGKPVYMPRELKVGRGTITIGFTCELDPELALDKDSFNVEQWNYIWSSDYGSPEVSIDDPRKRGREPVQIDSVSVSEDRRSVTLHIAGLRPVMQMRIQMKLQAADGTPVDYDIYNTINRVPASTSTPASRPAAAKVRAR
jgi:hypothetical protein